MSNQSSKKTISETFCIYPWDHLATLTSGEIIPCCVAGADGQLNLHQMSFKDAWNSETMKTIRTQMMQGQKPKACERCFIEEDSGIKSHRISSNQHHKNSIGAFEALLEQTDETGFYSGPIKSIDLRLGNNCNLQCVMCRPNESSKWAADIKKVIEHTSDSTIKRDLEWKSNITKENYNWFKNDRFWSVFYEMVPNMREMIVGGGEPFLIPEQNLFLEECVKRGIAKDLKIRYHTNGTVLPDATLETFRHFKKIEIMVSLDGVAEKNHYMRYPANWNSILTNLDKLDGTPDNVSIYVLSSMHAMSIFYFPDLIRWLNEQNYKKIPFASGFSKLPATGIVHNPSYINPQILPDHVKKEIRRRFSEMYEKDFNLYFQGSNEKSAAIERLNGNLDYMDAAEKSSELNQFKNYIYALDKSRKTNFSDIFPELAQLLDISKS